MTELTVQAPFNDLTAVQAAFARWGKEIACIIVEPVAGNMGCIPPLAGFLEGLRDVCDEHGALLIFDEVMTGFRVAKGGAQRLYKVKPDLTCLGKVIGGGLPAAAYGGRRKLMARIAPEGDVYQAGTLSGNPLAVAAGLETLRQLEEPGVYEKLTARSEQLATGLVEIAKEAGVPFSATALGGMFGFFFHPGPVTSYSDSQQSHDGRFRKFFGSMLEQGIYLAPSRFEAGFVSLAHRKRDIAQTLDAARLAMRKAARVA
jgi:glutamate-1-semialdehyde 2,1-aminomutase